MNRKKLSAKNIALMGFLMALQLILTRFFAFEVQFLRVTFNFIPTTIMALFFGPMLTGIGTTLSDFIGIFLFPKTAPYFPGFSISAWLTGVIYGLFLYKKETTWQRVFGANLVVILLIDVLLNSVWLYLMMGKASLAFLPVRAIKSLVFLPIQVILTMLLVKQKNFKQTLEKYSD